MVLVEAFIVLALAVLAAVGVSYVRNQHRENSVLAHTPAVALERHADVYKIARDSTRLLERLLDDDMVRVTVPESTQDQMRKAIDAFYDL